MIKLSGRELQIYEDLYKSLGARIVFSCDKVTYKGIIDMILPDAYQVKLRHVVIVEGDHYMGNLRFKFHEIPSFKVVESSESVNRIPRNEYLLNILKNDRPLPNKAMAKALFDDLSDDSDDDNIDEAKVDEKFVLEVPSHLENKLPKDFYQINCIGEDFYRAIHCISRQQVIGVSFHGSVISRFGKLAWICIATDICSYIFDVYQLGKEAFDEGLKSIFESKSVKKVIHDSRFPSDCLAHQFATLLSNVFDTRVADFVISMQKYNEKYKFYSYGSLDYLLRTYLDVPQEFIFQRETSQSTSDQSEFFSKRPISNDYLYDLLKSVMYLKLLQEKLSEELLAPFHRATGFYRTVLSKASTKLINFLGSDLSRPDQIPPCIIMNGIQTVYFQKPVQEEDISLQCSLINPQNGVIISPSLGTSAAKKACLLKKHNQENNMVSLKESDAKEIIHPQSSNGTSQVSSSQSACINGRIKTVSLSTKPSFRLLDEVYHKLANQMIITESENAVPVKPPADYASTFIDKQSVASCSHNNLDSSEKVSRENFDNISSVNKGHSNEAETDESNDVWARLRAEIAAERANYPSPDFERRKLKFVPG